MKMTTLSVTLCVALCACAPEPAAVVVRQPLTHGDSSSGMMPSHALPRKPVTPLPLVEVLTPDADAILAHPSMALPAALPEAQRARLIAAPLPVLMPQAFDEALLARATVTLGTHWYAISATHDGVTHYLQGTRTSVQHGQIELDEAGDALTRKPYILSRTHQIITVSFERFGLGYHMDVECAEPMTDPRCTEDEYAISLYESMALQLTHDQGGTP